MFINEEICNMKLSDAVINYNKLLLSVSWQDVNFDNSKFNNGFCSGVSELSEDQRQLLNMTLDLIPEWNRLINCKQHSTHEYTLDIHSILVLQKVQNLIKYSEFSPYQKLVLYYTALLHDVEKPAEKVDPEHPLKGAEKAKDILKRLNFDESFINDVYILIRNHQILGLIASDRISLNIEELIDKIKNPYLIDLLSILAIADIKSVKRNDAFYNESIGKKIELVKNTVHNYNHEN